MKRDLCRRRAVLLIALGLVLAAASCRPTRTDTPPAATETPTAGPATPAVEDPACPVSGAEVLFRDKVCDVECVINKVPPNGALRLCLPGTQVNQQLPNGRIDSVKCVDDQIVIELTTDRGIKRRETFDKKGNLVKTEEV